jgi:hypothetical protein
MPVDPKSPEQPDQIEDLPAAEAAEATDAENVKGGATLSPLQTTRPNGAGVQDGDLSRREW